MRGVVAVLFWVSSLGFFGCVGGEAAGGFVVPEERLASAEARDRGRRLYVAYCARCHGVDADGRGVGASAVTSPPTDFTSEVWQAQAKPEQVYVVIQRGIPGTAMPAWGFLPEGDVWDLTAYLLSLDGGAETTAE